MQAISYYLLLPLIYFISILPFRLLYLFSDVLFLILYHLLGYRKKIVLNNLSNSFPEKSSQEINQIAKEYYRYLCDLILEAFKKITMNSATTLKHCKFKNEQVLNQLFENNKSVILLMGHYGNWEWAGSSFSLSCKHQLYVVYKPLSNPYFEGLMCKTRTLFGTKLIKMQNTFKDILNNKDKVAAYAFIADQTPSPQTAHWTTFLNQDTALFTGAEKIAKKYDFPVVFINIKRIKRGYYEINAELITDQPKTFEENKIIEQYAHKLEKEIKIEPQTWLWSHRRWKHSKPRS
ncbi:MAG: lipid A biosynthesis acyltransferase [Cytophagales bacterium]|nr:MAG: lipid A biosynthesis acyltransferase [Cytophagales bacterium]